MTLVQWNACMMYKRNHTQKWMQENLMSKDQLFICKTACKLNASKLEHRRRQQQAEADSQAAAQKGAVEKAKKLKHKAERAKVDAVEPIHDVAVLRKVPCKITVAKLDLQLKWHRLYGVGSIPMQKDMNIKL